MQKPVHMRPSRKKLLSRWPGSGGAVTVIERAEQFGEVGAGIQIGPNVTRILHAWGLEHALAQRAAFPERLQVRSAMSARELAMLPLGTQMRERYGAPYATVHRADLHGLLLASQPVEQSGALPRAWAEEAAMLPERRRARLVADFVAGMTDRFAMSEHRRLCVKA